MGVGISTGGGVAAAGPTDSAVVAVELPYESLPEKIAVIVYLLWKLGAHSIAKLPLLSVVVVPMVVGLLLASPATRSTCTSLIVSQSYYVEENAKRLGFATRPHKRHAKTQLAKKINQPNV